MPLHLCLQLLSFKDKAPGKMHLRVWCFGAGCGVGQQVVQRQPRLLYHALCRVLCKLFDSLCYTGKGDPAKTCTLQVHFAGCMRMFCLQTFL